MKKKNLKEKANKRNKRKKADTAVRAGGNLTIFLEQDNLHIQYSFPHLNNILIFSEEKILA